MIFLFIDASHEYALQNEIESIEADLAQIRSEMTNILQEIKQ